MPCDDPRGVGLGHGREVQEGGNTWLISVGQNPTQHCKALFLQLKNK